MDRETKAVEEAKNRVKNYMGNGWTDHELSIFMKGFVEGSDWSIETVYHQPGDIPLNGEMILCETKDGPMIAGPFHKDFKDTVEHFGITRWAYTKELMPGVVPSPEKKEVNPKFRVGDLVVLKSYQKCVELNKDWQLNEAALKGLMARKFKIEDIEIENGQVFYKLDGGISTINRFPECFLDYVGNLLQVPKMNAVNPKYSTGQSVIIKSEGELRLLYGKDADLTDLIPYVNQEARIEDVIVTGDTITYMIRRYMMKGTTVREDAIKEPVPEYKKGQSVVIKSESDLHEIYYGNSILTYLLPFADKVVQIIDTIPSGEPAYTLYRIENEESNITLDVTYNAILCDANDRPQREPLECRNEIDSIIARDIHVAQLDTSKFNPSPMQIWNDMFSGAKGFLSSASPELRAFAAGQLLGLSEQLMPLNSCVSYKEKQTYDSTVYIALAKDISKYPTYVPGQQFLNGGFSLEEGKSFIEYRFCRSNINFSSSYLGLTSDNNIKGFTLTMRMYLKSGFSDPFVRDIFDRFVGKEVVVLLKEDKLPYYQCLYKRSGAPAVLDYQQKESGNPCFVFTVSPIERPDMLLQEKDFKAF